MARADQVVCPFFVVVFERLKNLINKDHKELGSLVGLVKELKKLLKTFFKIKQVLSDAEEKQFNKEEEAVRFWLHELNDAAYEADDVFDEFEYEALQQLASEEGASSSSSSNNVFEQLHGKIQNLIEIFQDLAKECSELDLQKGKEKEKNVVISPDRISNSLLTEPQVYGRDEDKEKLVKQLLGSDYFAFDQYGARRSKHPRALRGPVLNSSSNQDSISVFPILGMGGLGKTTLAQLVYNDKRVENHFEVRSWVCVSDDFDIKRLVKAFLASVSRSQRDFEDIEDLQQRLQKEVLGKRFLLVLDDVWEDRKDVWDKLMKFFEGGAQGSSIMVTTRLPTVASITSAFPPHCPNILSKRDRWALFKQYAFGPGNEERPALAKIGRKIMKKCGGIPLAVKTLGGLLRFKSDENEWLSIKDSKFWDFDNTILPSLRLSYHHLSFTLKQCFVYCSIFPKDHEIEKEQLIQLWMANGLVQSRAEMDLEDAGNAIFNELLWRSFFQDIEKDEDGNIISCKMHDLVHDLASYIAGDEYFVEDVESSRSPTEGTRHVFQQFGSSNLESSPLLRSLIQLKYRFTDLKSELIFSNCILLRALDLNSCGIQVVPDCIGEQKHLRYINLSYNPYITSLPESICLLRNMQTLSLQRCGIEVVPDCIGEMKHLRYLNLSDNPDITSLPESICLLKNMQTLSLRRCYQLSSLPEHIENMSCLVHLDNASCYLLTSMPVGIGQLTCLRTLGMFTVSKKSGCGVAGLQKLNNLRGELFITELDVVETLTEAKKANLMSKKNIHSLNLWWARALDSYSDSRQQRDQNVMEGLQPHSNVRKLEVTGYYGVTLSPSWLTEALLPNLVEISLESCGRCEHLGSLRKLPLLKVLTLSSMGSLKFIEEEEVVDDAGAGGAGGFPSLEELSLVWMDNLEGWSSSSSWSSSSQASAEERVSRLEVAAVFPCLKSVRLLVCPKLKGGIPLAWSPVQHVDINGSCNGMVLGSLRDLPSLPSLQISWFNELEYFPSGTLTNLTALRNLVIDYCDNLKTLPVELNSLTTLTELKIEGCPKLVSLAEERKGGLKNLSSLKTLVIVNCKALKRLPELHKASLVTLEISYCLNMEFSKEDFEHLVVLEQLELIDLPKLTCFPAGIKHSAATLRHLEFRPNYGAPVDLPDWIGTTLTSLEYLAIVAPENWIVLPQWMQHLTALKELNILCGEELVEQWRNRVRQREEDNSFSMIAHIPHVDLY